MIFIKLGGSLITDKSQEQVFLHTVMDRLAQEIYQGLQDNPARKLLIGHGSGSFGHVAASRYNTIMGVRSPEDWRGFAEVATAASRLNAHVAESLATAGIPIWQIQPSASALCEDGVLNQLEMAPIHAALDHDLVPLVYGDVSLDTVRGGTIISTEKLFAYLAQNLPVEEILLLGNVSGVYDVHDEVIPHITSGNLEDVLPALGGSAGTDVTGGMRQKVQEMLDLTQRVSHLKIRILDGTEPGLLQAVLAGEASPGTLITWT